VRIGLLFFSSPLLKYISLRKKVRSPALNLKKRHSQAEMTFKHLQVNLIGFYLATVFEGSAQTVVANRGKAAGKAIV